MLEKLLKFPSLGPGGLSSIFGVQEQDDDAGVILESIELPLKFVNKMFKHVFFKLLDEIFPPRLIIGLYRRRNESDNIGCLYTAPRPEALCKKYDRMFVLRTQGRNT